MRQLWLEKMASDGLIRPESVPHIYNEVNCFMKQGEKTFGGVMTPEKFEHIISGMAGAVAGAGTTALVQFLKKKWDQRAVRKNILKSRSSVINSFEQPEDKEKAKSRFDEIMRYAPNVAENPILAKKIVDSNLHSGLSDDTAQRLALIQASYVSTDYGHEHKDRMSMIPKVASIRPEVVGELAADVFVMAKSAALFTGKDIADSLKTILTYSAVPLTAGMIGGLVSSVSDKIKDKKLKENLDHSFREAVNGAPESHKEIFRQDMDKTRQAFGALAHFAPHVALQPHAARTFMKKMIDYYEQGGMNVTDVKELTEIEKNIGNTQKPGSFSRGFEGGTKFFGVSPISKGVESAVNKLEQERSQQQDFGDWLGSSKKK